MIARSFVLSFVCALLGLTACAGSMAEISRDEREREDSALLARGHHDDVVRIAGDIEGRPAESPAECEDTCSRKARVHELAERICAIAATDDHDEATQYLCEDAHTREAGLTRRAASCSCD